MKPEMENFVNGNSPKFHNWNFYFGSFDFVWAVGAFHFHSETKFDSFKIRLFIYTGYNSITTYHSWHIISKAFSSTFRIHSHGCIQSIQQCAQRRGVFQYRSQSTSQPNPLKLSGTCAWPCNQCTWNYFSSNTNAFREIPPSIDLNNKFLL